MEQSQFGFFKEAIIDNDGALIVTSTVSGTTNDLNGVLTQGNETGEIDILTTDGFGIRNSVNNDNAIVVNSDQVIIDASDGGNNFSEILLGYNEIFISSNDEFSSSQIKLDPGLIIINSTLLKIITLPTSDPGILNVIYRDGDFLKISNG